VKADRFKNEAGIPYQLHYNGIVSHELISFQFPISKENLKPE